MDIIGSLKMWGRPLICPFNEILAGLPEGVASFDIGCGRGYLLTRIAAEKRPTALGGIEISESLVKFARERIREVSPDLPLELSAYDGRNLPAALSNYDYVWMVDVLHHIPPGEQAAALKAIGEKMKPGAVLVMKDIDAGRRILCLANKLHDLLSAGEVGHERSRDEAARLLRESGLDLTESGVRRMWVYPHYWHICRKPAGANA
jgi:2-polyprenyl-3-methyl-5-hydroxy-6-metoxy-1,4-benzoquinol methylase